MIAREIGEMQTGNNLIDFLVDCGVNRDVIEYPQTKWRMVYDVFISLASSPNPKNQEILFKIIEESSHPLMHNGDEDFANSIQDKFNKLLKYDEYTLKNFKIKKRFKEKEEDSDLDLYIKKKILVEKWRITQDIYDTKLNEYKEKQYDVNLQMEEYTRADENFHIAAAMVFSLANRALEIFESSEANEKRQLLSFLLQNCRLQDKKLLFELRSPFNYILENAQYTSVLRR